MTTLSNNQPSVSLHPGDRVRLLDGGHRPAVLEHIGRDGFARVRADGVPRPIVVGLDRLSAETITELDFTVPYVSDAVESRPCPPWCDNPGGHHGELPADRSCWSTDRSIALNRDGWSGGLPTIVDTGAQLRAEDTEPVVLVSLRGGAKDLGINLTSWEARRLAADLLFFASLIEGGPQ
ncbi:DUF6907 domain-containing protein [Nocardia farcinica]